MAEKMPLSCSEKVETKEKQVADVSSAILTPEDKTEGFEETGYGSAPGSSEVMSGAESSVWTSDDHGTEDARIQKEPSITKFQDASVLEVTSGGLDIATKPADVIKKPTSKKPKLGFFKKSSPISKRVASTAELTESLIPSEEEDKKTKFSPRKTRSRSKYASGLPKLVSLRKTRTSDKSQSCPPAKQEKGVKSSPIKSPKLSSGIPMSVTAKKQRLMVPSQDEEHGLGSEKEMTAKSSKSSKSKSPSKAKHKAQATSTQTKHGEGSSQAGESDKAGECSVKPKRAPKLALGMFKPAKQIATAEQTLIDAKPDTTSMTSSAFALVRKGIKKMDVSGKLKKSAEKADETCLIEKDEKTARSKSSRKEDESSEDRSLNEPYIFKKTSWKPGNPAQEGGLLAEDMIAYVSSSEKDTTPTEISTLSDSSVFVRGKSKSQRSRHLTLDSVSKVSSFEEEVEGSAGIEGDARPQLQRQTKVPDLEMEEDSGDVFLSPEHKVTPRKKSDDETKE